MRVLTSAMVVCGAVLLIQGAAMAQPPGSLDTVVSKDTIPGNGDYDENGQVDAVDALKVLQIVGSGITGDGKVPTGRGFQQGDANLNGRLDREDGRLIQQHVAGTLRLPTKQLMRGDVNGNGLVTTADAILVARYLENITSSPPAPWMSYNADANQDYLIDQRDVTCIQRIYFGLGCQ